MARITPGISTAIDSMAKSLEAMSSILASSSALNTTVKTANSFSSDFGSSNALLQTALEITNQYNSIFSGNELLTKSFLNVFVFQTELLRNTRVCFPTKALKSFQNYLLHNDYSSALKGIATTLTLPTIEAPNIAFLKLNKTLLELPEIQLPRGMRSVIDHLHQSTAQDLSKSDCVTYDSGKATFFVKNEPQNCITSKEANVLYSVRRLFDDLTETELMEFLRHLSSFYVLGAEHPVGQKILGIVSGLNNVISFDSELYYHARSLGDGACPFTDEDMACAPHGIASFGRFNHIGDNYYYFSNQQIGAIEEVRKHNPKNRVQVAKLKTRSDVKIVDISQNEENTFLKYCRFPYDPLSRSQVPREYLIPSFFSACCKSRGFDGIKYYGTADYQNYVTWSDGHFVCTGQEIK